MSLGLFATLAGACGEPGETADGSDIETGSETGDADVLDPACAAADPDVDALFDVAVEGWEKDGYGFFDVDDDCLISSLEIAEGVWTTELDCDDADAEQKATLAMAASGDEFPDWAEGDEVHLQVSHSRNSFGGIDWFELRRGETLLAEGMIGGELEGAFEAAEARVGGELSYDECEAPMPGSGSDVSGKLAVHFELGEASLVLVSGHRGAFDLGDGRALWIDVEQAESGLCCHSFHNFRILKRRTVTQD